jgi:hypothetical protein
VRLWYPLSSAAKPPPSTSSARNLRVATGHRESNVTGDVRHKTRAGGRRPGAGKYETGTTAPADLDPCNGHVGDVPADSEYGLTAGAVYHYHMTEHFPHTIGCFGPVADEVWT